MYVETFRKSCTFLLYIYLSTAKNQNRKLEKMFPEEELRSHSPNFHIHVSVSDLYIPTIDLSILWQEICGPILGIYKSLTDTCMWIVKIRTEAAQFPLKEHINGVLLQ
jgi:hypothetical protein